MATLNFKTDQLLKMLAHNEKATEFRVSYDQAIRAYEAATGKKYSFDGPKIPDEFYRTKTHSVMFVKDEGIYLMAAGVGVGIPEDKSHVCYADKYGPDADYDEVRYVAGGDDFAITMRFDPEWVDFLKSGKWALQINLTQSSISMRLKAVKTKAKASASA